MKEDQERDRAKKTVENKYPRHGGQGKGVMQKSVSSGERKMKRGKLGKYMDEGKNVKTEREKKVQQ